MRTRTRSGLCALLGLILLLQGWALAASPRTSINAADDASVAAALALATIGCPAHRTAPTAGGLYGHAPSSSPSCCDAACPDMLNCALGQLTVASPVPTGSVQLPQTPRPALATAQRRPQAPGRLLRPPIQLHA